MSDPDALDERLRAVERAVTGDDTDLTGIEDAAELTREIEAVADRLDDVEDRLDHLDAATQALRGYVGNVRAVNEAVERRADAALAKAESLAADDVTTSDEGVCDPRHHCECRPRRPGGSGTDSAETDTDSATDPESSDEDSGLLAQLTRSL